MVVVNILRHMVKPHLPFKKLVSTYVNFHTSINYTNKYIFFLIKYRLDALK